MDEDARRQAKKNIVKNIIRYEEIVRQLEYDWDIGLVVEMQALEKYFSEDEDMDVYCGIKHHAVEDINNFLSKYDVKEFLRGKYDVSTSDGVFSSIWSDSSTNGRDSSDRTNNLCNS